MPQMEFSSSGRDQRDDAETDSKNVQGGKSVIVWGLSFVYASFNLV